MQHSFSHVKIDALVGLSSKELLDVKAKGAEYGIEERRLKRFIKTNGFEHLSIINPPVSLGDLCIRCCSEIFSQLDISPSSIDALIISSQTHDYIIPGTSFTLQERLGLSHDCLMFDMIQGCPGYVNSLLHAATLIESKVCKKVLVCVGEVSNHYPAPGTDNLELYLESGDGCSATLLSYSEDENLLDFSIQTYGNKCNVVMDGSYGTRATRVADEVTKKGFNILGQEMNLFVLETVKDHIKGFMHERNLSFSDIECCFSQQTSLTLVKALNAVLDAPENWMPFYAKDLGNLSSASIPVFMSNKASNTVKCIEKSMNKTVLLSGFGVGLASSLCITDFTSTKILPIILY